MTEGRPHVVDLVKNGEMALIINTVEDRRNAIQDSCYIRHAAIQNRITYYTTMAEARAACIGLQHMKELRVYDVQGLHRQLAETAM